jgi:hypothetical protein
VGRLGRPFDQHIKGCHSQGGTHDDHEVTSLNQLGLGKEVSRKLFTEEDDSRLDWAFAMRVSAIINLLILDTALELFKIHFLPALRTMSISQGTMCLTELLKIQTRLYLKIVNVLSEIHRKLTHLIH